MWSFVSPRSTFLRFDGRSSRRHWSTAALLCWTLCSGNPRVVVAGASFVGPFVAATPAARSSQQQQPQQPQPLPFLTGRSFAVAAASADNDDDTMATTTTTTTLSEPEQMEAVVRRYFEGVNQKDPTMIRSCFGETATIRDVCSLVNPHARTVDANVLVERCMEFLAAHPDCKVDFYYGPLCGRSSSSWVVAHWFEVGTWSGDSGPILAPDPPQPMAVEGQTRFRVNPQTMVIEEFVVTRTFTPWEEAAAAAAATAKEGEEGAE